MTGEETVYETNLAYKKKPERHADQARRDAQPVIQARKTPAGICKRQHHGSGNEHHSRNRPDPKHKQVPDSPFWILNCAQHQKCDSRGACQAVHKPHDEWPRHLIQTQPATMAVEPS